MHGAWCEYKIYKIAKERRALQQEMFELTERWYQQMTDSQVSMHKHTVALLDEIKKKSC